MRARMQTAPTETRSDPTITAGIHAARTEPAVPTAPVAPRSARKQRGHLPISAPAAAAARRRDSALADGVRRTTATSIFCWGVIPQECRWRTFPYPRKTSDTTKVRLRLGASFVSEPYRHVPDKLLTHGSLVSHSTSRPSVANSPSDRRLVVLRGAGVLFSELIFAVICGARDRIVRLGRGRLARESSPPTRHSLA
jgi:hypothetical protein